MNETDKEPENPDEDKPINEKMLAYSILGMLGISFLALLFVIVPWMVHENSPSWKQILIDDSIVLVTIVMFVYGFYMNTKIH